MALRTRAARKVAAALVAAPLIAAPVAAAGPAVALPAQAPANVDATIDNKFLPPTLQVPAGTTVTWTNKGGLHTVTGGEGPSPDPASPIGNNTLDTQGKTVQKTFDKEGTYPYFCVPHLALGMKGSIVVTAAGGGAAPAGESAGAGASASATAGGSAVPAGEEGAGGGQGPAGAPAGGESQSGTAGAPGASVSAVPSGEAPEPDPSLGARARGELAEKLENEAEPLSKFRLALWALTAGIILLGAGVYFLTKPSRAEV